MVGLDSVGATETAGAVIVAVCPPAGAMPGAILGPPNDSGCMPATTGSGRGVGVRVAKHCPQKVASKVQAAPQMSQGSVSAIPSVIGRFAPSLTNISCLVRGRRDPRHVHL